MKLLTKDSNVEVRHLDDRTIWIKNGMIHRDDDEPASVHHDGTKAWYRNGVLHRENGPAILESDGSQFWCKNGDLHREDGPAVVGLDSQEWFVLGKKVEPFTPEQYPLVLLQVLEL